MVLSCSGGSTSPSPTAGTSTTGTQTPPAGPTATLGPGVTPTRPPAGPPSLTMTGFVVGDGQFDPHRTQVGTLQGQQAFVYSRLLSYEDQAANILRTDLATAMPQQPDELTYVFKLNPAARWHDVSPLDGRQVTAEDVVHSFDRQRLGDRSVFVRQSRWSNIASIDAPDSETVIITTAEPLAPMLNWLADPTAMIVAPEMDATGFSAEPDGQVGSGPFRWLEWTEGEFASVIRNEEWFGSAPALAGITVLHAENASEVVADLRVKDLDAAFVGRTQADAMKEAVPGLVESHVGNALFFGMRFTTSAPPFNDVRVRTALAIAMNRTEMIDIFFDGSGDRSGWVSWPVSHWALPFSELSEWPGYRLGSGGRAQDIQDARQQMDAYVADGNERPTTLELHVEQTSEETFSLGSLIARHVGQALGIEVTINPLPVEELVGRLLDPRQTLPWVAGPDSGWLDLDDWLYPYFHSAGVQNSFALRNEDLDALIVAQRAQFNPDDRRNLGLDIQRQLLQINAGINLVSERVVALSQPYVRAFPLDITDGYQDRFARCWVDVEDPSYRKR